MKKIKSNTLLDELEADIRQIISDASFLKTEDPGFLLQQPAPGKWSVIQVIEHLNSYDRYYLLAIEKSLQSEKPSREFFKPGWLGNYFTKMMKPGEDGGIPNKMQAPKNHRPGKYLDAFPVLTAFIEYQHYLLGLLEQARSKDLDGIRTPVSISRFIKLKLGDTFRFLIAHKQRHFVQIRNTLVSVKAAISKYPEALPAV